MIDEKSPYRNLPLFMPTGQEHTAGQVTVMHRVLFVGAQLVVCAVACAIGFIMAFRPALYRRWARASYAGRKMPTMTEDWLRDGRNFRSIGVLFILLGVCSFAGFLYIDFVR